MMIKEEEVDEAKKADDEMDEARMLWESQIDDLHAILGG